MTKNEAKAVAQQLGDIPLNDEKLQIEIQRLNRKSFIPLQQVEIIHDWLEGKRQSRQSGRVVGESRTGNKLEISVILVGTARLDAVIKRDKQVCDQSFSRLSSLW